MLTIVTLGGAGRAPLASTIQPCVSVRSIARPGGEASSKAPSRPAQIPKPIAVRGASAVRSLGRAALPVSTRLTPL